VKLSFSAGPTVTPPNQPTPASSGTTTDSSQPLCLHLVTAPHKLGRSLDARRALRPSLGRSSKQRRRSKRGGRKWRQIFRPLLSSTRGVLLYTICPPRRGAEGGLSNLPPFWPAATQMAHLVRDLASTHCSTTDCEPAQKSLPPLSQRLTRFSAAPTSANEAGHHAGGGAGEGVADRPEQARGLQRSQSCGQDGDDGLRRHFCGQKRASFFSSHIARLLFLPFDARRRGLFSPPNPSNAITHAAADRAPAGASLLLGEGPDGGGGGWGNRRRREEGFRRQSEMKGASGRRAGARKGRQYSHIESTPTSEQSRAEHF